MNRIWGLLFAGLLTTVACGPQPEVTRLPDAGLPAKGAGRAAWEQKWERALAEGRKEGTVRVYTLWGANTRTLLAQAVKQNYGIELEFVPFARGPEVLARVEAEKRAGLSMADVFGVGASTLITLMKPAGLLGSIESRLILPEVTDATKWRGNVFPFLDKDRQVIGMIAAIQRHISYNTDLIKEGEITAYRDLLRPQYKGKIAMADPTMTGTANDMFGLLAHDIWNEEEAKQFLRQLIRQQEAIIQREHRIVVEWVARGKYAIGLAGQRESVQEFISLGAPITLVVQKEGHKAGTAAGGLSVPTVSSHPNAATVFVNWLLSKEGQKLFAVDGYGSPSLRADVPTEGMHPLFVPQPGEKLFTDSEERIIFTGKFTETIRQVIAEASK
ncbi:MAG: extracellular solute-binding protein [Chloroflexi bacterium]|nr:extracellular solute-binding protein [Chloroflexota bacterium]